MSVINKNRCPACEAELVGNICEKCGYVLLIFPEKVPDSVAKMEKERITVIKKRLADVAELERRIASKTRETNDLNSTIANLKEKLQQSAFVPQSSLCGVVMIEDVRNDVRTVLPIYDGTNTYGSNPDSGMHHQIRLLARGISFLPVHFTVRASPKGLVFEAAAGVTITTKNGRLITASAVYARMSDNFMIGDRIRISVSQI